MPLLDGKYEILTERTVAGGSTRFEATSPEGETVRVVWYDVRPADEGAFERYRRLLKGLAREGRAALVDIVSRPGARYVAWRMPSPDMPSVRDAELEAALAEAGFEPGGADVRRDGRAVRLYDLPFAGASAPSSLPARTAESGSARRAPDLGARLRRLELSNAALSWVVALALIAVASAAAAAGFAARANDRLVVVPDLVGTAVREAAQRLAALGLRVDAVAVASDRPPGELLSVEPRAGMSLRPGRGVRVTYAASPGHLAPATVPLLVGAEDADAAGARLEAAGLVLGRVARVHADAAAGAILAQSVPGGATLGQGQAVDVVVSLGPRPETTFLPDLVGLDLEDARYLATVAGLAADQLVVERVQSEAGLPGRVLSQSLAPYVRVPRDESTLRLLVVDDAVPGRQPVGLPQLAGLDLERARSLAAGYEVRVETVEDRALPDGVVMQSLAPGAQPGDGPLVLTVNVRPVPVPRPAVRIEVRAPAVRTLSFAWFIEPGIPTQRAEVRARTLRGDDELVLRREVRGGEMLRDTWTTTAPGPVRFTLTLNGEPYGGDLLVP